MAAMFPECVRAQVTRRATGYLTAAFACCAAFVSVGCTSTATAVSPALGRVAAAMLPVTGSPFGVA